jgi:hypothetical protein
LDLYLTSLPVTLFPAHAPVLPEAGVLDGIVLVTPDATEIVPFDGFFVTVTVTGVALQLRSHARSCAIVDSVPDRAERVSSSVCAAAGAAPINEAVTQASEKASVRILTSKGLCGNHSPFQQMIAMIEWHGPPEIFWAAPQSARS